MVAGNSDAVQRIERLRPDGRLLSWRLLVPGGVPWLRPWPFLIQWDVPDDERLAWERRELTRTERRGSSGLLSSSPIWSVESTRTSSSSVWSCRSKMRGRSWLPGGLTSRPAGSLSSCWRQRGTGRWSRPSSVTASIPSSSCSRSETWRSRGGSWSRLVSPSSCRRAEPESLSRSSRRSVPAWRWCKRAASELLVVPLSKPGAATVSGDSRTTKEGILLGCRRG